jgi:hypothetical protein
VTRYGWTCYLMFDRFVAPQQEWTWVGSAAARSLLE